MNTRLNVDRFKTARLARAKGLAGASTLLHDLLDRTRAAGTLSDLASRWKRSSPTTPARGWELPYHREPAQSQFVPCDRASLEAHRGRRGQRRESESALL